MKQLLFAILVGSTAAYSQTGDPVRSMETAPMMVDARGAPVPSKAQLTQEEQIEFSRRFNRLLDVMRDFTDEYNRGGGKLWPQKKADALERAYRDLQKTSSWKRASLTP